MSAVAGHRIGRGWLQVTPGRCAVLRVHDIAASVDERSTVLARAQEDGAWSYVQRGHAPSTGVAGGVYRVSDFVLDLVRVLRGVVGRPVVVAADGASALVAALAAAAEPELVRGLRAGPAAAEGWGARPELLVSEVAAPNPAWLAAVRQRPTVRAPGDDPVLRYGPPESMPVRAVAAALGRLELPWSAPEGHVLEPWLPEHCRQPG